MLPNVVDKEVADRVAVIVTGYRVEKLLGVPKLRSGKGSVQANAFVELVTEWSVADKIKALSFDTTASNTGQKNGACTLIMQQLKTNLLHLACRHYISEIMIEKAFVMCVGSSFRSE